VVIGAVQSAPKAWKKGSVVAVSGLWVYAREQIPAQTLDDDDDDDNDGGGGDGGIEDAPPPHVCDQSTGYDSKHGQCLRVAACDSAVLGQHFERFPCSHWGSSG
jgi:hypothetical protein